jgi:hypothetical protein
MAFVKWCSFYELPEPTHWVEPPEIYSFSTLQAIKSCPRRWQLLHSGWGPFSQFPERPQPAAIEGQIVHAALELLARELGRLGRPPIGSTTFQKALTACGFWSFFATQIQVWNQRLGAHPRAGPPYVLRTKPQELTNQTIRLFRETYLPGVGQSLSSQPDPDPFISARLDPLATNTAVNPAVLLQTRGGLAEIRLRHPTLPIAGVMDVVTLDQQGTTTILDFKTGKQKPAHIDQVHLYALLWWRCCGAPPDQVVLQYLDTAWSQPVSTAELSRVEEAIVRDINYAKSMLLARPAPPNPGSDCIWCPVRPRCNEGWAQIEPFTQGKPGKSVAIELTLIAEPSSTGFLGLHSSGLEYSVAYDVAISSDLPLVRQGDRIRFLDAMAGQTEREILLRPWTEIYPLLKKEC